MSRPTLRDGRFLRAHASGALRQATLGLSTCLAVGACQVPNVEPRPIQRPVDDTVVGTPIALPTRAPFDEIARLEELRSTGNGRLFELLVTADSPARARAAQALGRMPLERPGDEITTALCRALDDTDPSVRRRVAFGLGIRGDSTAAGVLGRHWYDPETSVRVRIVDAATRIGERDLKDQILLALNDPEQAVRLEVLAGVARWDSQARDAGRVDSQLLTVLDPRGQGGAAARTPSDDEVWITLYALARRKSERGRGAFLEHIDDVESNARLFATMGLGALRAEPGSTRALERRARDTDWRIAVEAIRGLKAHADGASIPVLEEGLRHASAHVRAEAVAALGTYKNEGARVLDSILRAERDRSAVVRANTLVSHAKVGDPKVVAADLAQWIHSQRDEVIQEGCARALRYLEADLALPMLENLSEHASPFVANTAFESLGELGDKRGLEILRREIDAGQDNGRRLSAVLALRPHSSERDLEALERAIASAAGDGAAELTWNALKNVRQIGGEAARQILGRALRYPHPEVCRVAKAELLELFPEEPLPEVSPQPEVQRSLPPLPGLDYPNWTRNPVVEILTTRGPITLELFPSDAPVHVYNFIKLIEKAHYDGLSFHRVVPDFVIQGGDYRGDGNGALDWRGGDLRAEFNERKFMRGSLGMPRNEHADSGGSQIFISQRPTPHLDGNYTLFGQVVRGFDVLDLIEVGDRIVSVEILPEPRPGVGLR